jgi:hypothetical protein
MLGRVFADEHAVPFVSSFIIAGSELGGGQGFSKILFLGFFLYACFEIRDSFFRAVRILYYMDIRPKLKAGWR